MSESGISGKGRITLPLAILAHSRVGPGDRIRFSQAGDGTVRILAVGRDIDELRKCLPPPTLTASLQDTNNAAGNPPRCAASGSNRHRHLRLYSFPDRLHVTME
ncbi:MAG: prlF antitoxin for toxin YhaV toxin [Pseudomonadota bacterium]|jgi:bifunctional DNA-binding transcriptional regulator/antitoxin component of YhaV-PrlF toxin-antitoxin module